MTLPRPRLKIILLLSLLVLVSGIAGFFVGAIMANVINKKKEQPPYWRSAALGQLSKLHPDPAQKKKFETRTDAAVQELTELRKKAIKDTWEIIDRATADIAKDLTPEQRVIFEKIKPKDKPPEAK